jgi:hypothetical protein
MTTPHTLPTALRWCLGLLLPGALCLLLALGLVSCEADAGWGARQLGRWLLAHNTSRLATGATWQNISAQRRARSLLDSSTRTLPIDAQKLPSHLLVRHYAQLQRTPHFARWHSSTREVPLAAHDLNPRQLRLLAESIQAFEQVDELLRHMILPVDFFDVHARIQAQTALEDGSLFSSLHQQLLAQQAPEAWNFTHMSAQDQRYWRGHLRPLLSPEAAAEDLPEAPIVGATLAALVTSCSDSLRRIEVERLRHSWQHAADFELRLVRNLDAFVGYVLLAGELPVRFVVPEAIATQAVDPPQESRP